MTRARARLTNRDRITELSTDQFTEWRHKIPAYFYARTLMIFDVRRHPATRNAHISKTIRNFVSNTEAKRTSAGADTGFLLGGVQQKHFVA